MAVGEIEVARAKPFKPTQMLALVLVIPHSNAAAERMFSCVNKDLTPGRSSLSKDGTLNNIVIVKSADLHWKTQEDHHDYVVWSLCMCKIRKTFIFCSTPVPSTLSRRMGITYKTVV